MRDKHPPGPGGPKLVHETVQTGHRAEFALDLLNYDPRAIGVAQKMFETGQTVGGFRLQLNAQPFPAIQKFLVLTVAPVSSNYVTVEDGSSILLATAILPAATAETPEVMEAAADIEQCAAIALALQLSDTIRRLLTEKHS